MARKIKTRYGVDTGVFTLTGNVLHFSQAETAGTGVFTLTGSDASLIKNVTPSLAADTGVFLETGNNANLLLGTVFSVSTGTFSMTAADGTFVVNRTPSMIAESGTFLLTGNDATLVEDVVIDVDTIEAETATYTVDSGPVTYVLNIFVGDECHPAFQIDAFQFNAFQTCLDIEVPPEEPSVEHGGRQIFPEIPSITHRWKEGANQLYARKQIREAARVLGRKGGLANRRWR